MSQNTSENLLNRFLSGSETAAFEIHSRYETRVVGLAQTRLMSVLSSKVDPEDISQETFADFFELARRDHVKWQTQGDLWRLLAGIAINKVKRKFERFAAQKRNAQNEVSVHEQELTAASSVEVSAAIELSDLLDNLLANEKPLMRTVLAFRMAGNTFEEIAQRTGRSTRTIRRLMDGLKARIIADSDLTQTLGITSGPEYQTKGVFENVDYTDFQLLCLVGEGSFSKVYLARKISTREIFALKAVKKKWLGNDQVRQTFSREIELLTKLNDPNVITIYGLGQLPNGGCFLVLEYVDGKPLSNLVLESDLSQRKLWWTQLAETIQRLHHAKVIHGDLRLSNVMVDAERNVRLVDFGLGSLLEKNGSVDQKTDLAALNEIKKILIDRNLTSDKDSSMPQAPPT